MYQTSLSVMHAKVNQSISDSEPVREDHFGLHLSNAPLTISGQGFCSMQQCTNKKRPCSGRGLVQRTAPSAMIIRNKNCLNFFGTWQFNTFLCKDWSSIGLLVTYTMYIPPSTHNSHLLIASLLVVINECPLDVSWAGNLSGLEVGKLGKIVPKARNFF